MGTAMISNAPDLAHFFWEHLRVDLRIIGKCLSHGENEVLMVLHGITHYLAEMQPVVGKCMTVLDLYTKLKQSTLSACVYCNTLKCTQASMAPWFLMPIAKCGRTSSSDWYWSQTLRYACSVDTYSTD